MLLNFAQEQSFCSTSGRACLQQQSSPCPAAQQQSSSRRRRRSGRPSLQVARAAQEAFCKDKVNITKQVTVEGSAMVTFLGAEGQSLSVECPKDEYILEAGLQNDVELPYTCRGGICGACVGRLVEGKVDMSDIDDLSFVLSEDEIAQGMTLICMARPVTDCKIETQSDWGYSLGVEEWKGPTGHITGKDPNHLMVEA